MQKLAQIYIIKIVMLHGIPSNVVYDRVSSFEILTNIIQTIIHKQINN